jgi:hypothetical protein
MVFIPMIKNALSDHWQGVLYSHPFIIIAPRA